MDNQSIVFQLIKIFSEFIIKDTISYNGSDFVFQLEVEEYEANTSILLELFDSSNSLPDRKISLKFSKIKINNFHVFYRKDDFLKSKNYIENFNIKTILILDDEIVFKLENEEFSKERAIIFNNYTYQKLLSYLKANQIFSSLKGNSNEFVVVSKENSIMHIGYKNIEPRLEELDDIYPQYELLKKRFEKIDLHDYVSENVEFIKLFIENISTAGFGNNKEKKEDSLFEIVKGLKILISLTERDYENYINNFSFEKIKSKFKDERNKYFEGLEKNIELISKQVISFPLTFGATAFASYQVKDKYLILCLIFIAYLLYTLIAFKILKITSYNIKCLEGDINKEEQEIIKNFNKNHSDFEDDFKKIRNKTKKIEDLICYLKIILSSMLLMFLTFIIYQIFISKKDIIKENVTIPIEKINFIQIDSVWNSPNSIKIDTISVANNTKLKDSTTNSLKAKNSDSIKGNNITHRKNK